MTDGTYSAALSVGAGTDVRVELTGLPSFAQPGPFGSDSGTTVLFAQSGDTSIDIGLANPAQHCQLATGLGDLSLATNCYITGTQSTSADDVLVSYDYLAGDTGPTGNVDLPAEVHLASAQEIGPTWGLGYQRSSDSLFAGAFMKRHVSFLSDGGTGRIFRIDLATTTASLFLDLDSLFGAGTAGTDPHPAGTNLVTDNNNDGANGGVDEAWDAVGKRAFGDLDIGDDELTLYAVNLFDRSLYSIPLSADPSAPVAPGMSSAITVTPIPHPCGNAADARPFALTVKDGTVYVGGVCSAESSQATADLSAYVYTFTDGGGFAAAPILSFPINYGRGCVVVPGCASANWNPWSPTFTFNATTFTREIVFPEPMLTDLDFDGEDLILGFRDRFGDQTGFDQRSTVAADATLYRGDSAGSVRRACLVGGVLALESNGSCGGVAGAGVGNGNGPGGGEFYVIDYPDHAQVAMAGVAQVPGFPDVPFTMYDPIFNSAEFFDGGAGWNSGITGGGTRRYRIYSSNDSDPNTFAKGGGLGDLEALCQAAPIEIGNRVWADDTINGVQDPGEPVLPGVGVTLVCSSAGINVSTTTDANGQYLFNSGNVSGGVPVGVACEVRINPADANLGGRVATLANSGSNDLHDSDGVLAGGFIAASFTTGAAGFNNHTYDFGFTMLSTGSVGDTVWCDGLAGTGNGVFDAGEGLANVTVSLFADSDCNDVADGAATATQTTVGDGQYLFTGLPIGPPGSPVCYVVQVDAADPDLGTCDAPITPIDFAPDLDTNTPDDLTNDFGFEEPCDDPDGDGICNESCTDDRDDDGIADCDDFDPQGYFYCGATGAIVPGGLVGVTGPGAVNLVEDGSSGRYVFLTDGTPGTYSLSVTPPAGTTLSTTCTDLGVLDPTGIPDPLVLGSGEQGSTGVLGSADCMDNPYYLTFDLEAGDPSVINNNLPLEGCGVPPTEIPTTSEWGLAFLALLLAGAGSLLLKRS